MIRTVESTSEDGSSLVEFALAAVLILTTLFGIADVGRALLAYDYVANAARTGTRFAMVRGTSCSALSGGCPANQSDIQTYLRSNATGLDSSALTVTAACMSGASLTPPCDPGKPIRVAVQYSFAFVTPLIPYSWTMTSSSQVVVSQ